MTVRLLADYDRYPVNAIVTLDAGTEAGLIAAKRALADTTGGVPFVPVSGPVQTRIGSFTVRAGRAETVALPEGYALMIAGDAGTVGTVQRVDAAGVPIGSPVAVGAGALPAIGSYAGAQKLLIGCTAGSISALLLNAVVGVLKSILLGIFGQSNERGAIFRIQPYTPSTSSGNGTIATISTTIANNLPPGAIVYGQRTGTTPAAYNTATFVPMVVGGTWPNCTLSYASTGTGAHTVAGSVRLDQKLSYPAAFSSQKYPNDVVPIWPAVTRDMGGWWHSLEDKLAGMGYRASLVNGAIGAMSFATDAAGRVRGWGASQQYRTARAPKGRGDSGSIGALIIPSGTFKLMECTSGGDNVYATYDGADPIRIGSEAIYKLDSVRTQASGAVSGASEPNWASVTAVGQTIVDGGLTWTCRSVDTRVDPDSTIQSISAVGQVLAEGQLGFDPLGIIARFWQAFSSVTPTDKRFVLIENAQSDIGLSSPYYANALVSIASFFANRGATVFIGLSLFFPGSDAVANRTAYDRLTVDLGAALVTLQASFPGQIYAGPNLYSIFGSVHGSNGLYLESDNLRPAENIHAQGVMADPIADAWLSAIKPYLQAP